MMTPTGTLIGMSPQGTFPSPSPTPMSPMPPPPPSLPTPKVIPLPRDGHGSRQYWQQQIEDAIDRVAQQKTDWDNNVLSYRAKGLSTIPTTDTVVVPRDFAFVEQKSAQIFFQTPEIHLKTNLQSLSDAVPQWQPVVNYHLSEDGVNALAAMNEMLFDALCASGLLCCKIGYECFFDRVDNLPTGNQVPNPDYQEPSQSQIPEPGPNVPEYQEASPEPESTTGSAPPPIPPGMETSPDGTPGTEVQSSLQRMIDELMPTPNIVYERYFMERFSPAKVLIPRGFSSSTYDKAPWLGMRFEEEWESLRRRLQIPDGTPMPRSKSVDLSELELMGEKGSGTTTRGSTSTKVQGVELWYYTYLYDRACAHPEKLRQLILITGMEEPLVHRDSPYQRMSTDGRLLLGMIGNPIHIGALRYVSDTAFPPSECTIARATNEELNKSRTQQMMQRDRSIPMRFASLTRIGGEKGLTKLRQNIYQSIIPLPDLDPNNPPILPVQLAHMSQENFQINSIIDQDLGQIWAMGANQRGQESENSLTATEISKIDQWANTRLDKERRQALTYYISATRKLGGLLQLFLTDQQITDIIGPDKFRRLSTWDRKQTPGAFAYTANPDSAIRIDQAQARTQILKLYELLAKDQLVDRRYLLTEVFRQWNLDPATGLVQKLPEKGPDPASVSIALKPEFLDTTNPNFPIYLALLEAAGFTTLEQPKKNPETGEMEPSPVEQAMAFHKLQQGLANMAETGTAPEGPQSEGGTGTGATGTPTRPSGQPEHPGAAPHADRLSKHHADDGGDGNLRGPTTGQAKPH